ncbi:unnamed protein product [Chironomus riparius]|uniref:F-box domain-containing protein n=1 Tax=Chironomus riparius TaxID=315576 RepID=A0A9N9X078_9DIPT|nr:unnamed protein product [Chironomus riparius]
MFKRRISFEDFKDNIKLQKLSSSNQELNNNVSNLKPSTKPHLPVQIITKVIANLTNTNDIKNCMLLSKDVNSCIFRTPEILTRLLFNLDCTNNSDECSNFLKFKGNEIKNIKLSFNSESTEILKTVLSQTPNLTDFTFTNVSFGCVCCGSCSFPTKEQDSVPFKEYWTLNSNSIDLPELKVLEMEVTDLYSFIKVTNQVKSLEKLTIYIHSSKHQKIMTEFILQQENLKELNIIVTETDGEVNFLSRNIARKLKFKLKTLKIFTKNGMAVNGYLDEFLLAQIDSLEELDFDFSLDISTLDIVFNKLRKLRMLIKVSYNQDFF